VYRQTLVEKTLRIVSEWKASGPRRNQIKNNRLKSFIARLERLVTECDEVLLPKPAGADLEDLATDLADYLSILPHTDCWQVHGNGPAGEAPPGVCSGCPFVGPVQGLSGDLRYHGCDVLAFMGEKVVDHRIGLPANAWPEPGVWYSGFETNPRTH
jgi:hypothetical protein